MKFCLPLQFVGLLHWKDPLYRNSFLILSSWVVSAVFGLLFWMLAAKYYSKEDVGVASALISSMILIVLISGFGLGESIIRFFPERDKSKVFSTSVTITTFFTLIFGIIFIVGIDIWSPELGILKTRFAIPYLLFIAGYSILLLTGTSFIALRRAEFNFFQQIIAGSRVVFLIPLTFLGAMGIFGAVGLSQILACVVTLFLLVRSGVSFVLTFDWKFLRDALHFSASTYFAGLLINAPGLILPIMVLIELGATAAAYYCIVNTIVVLLYMIPSAVSTSLFVEGSHGEGLRKNTYKSLIIIGVLLIPAVIILYLFGGFFLEIFGKSYVEALDLLRILAISSFFIAVVNVYFSIKKVQKDMKVLIFLSAFVFVLLIGLSYIFMQKSGILGVGYAWAVAYSLGCIIVGVMMYRDGWL